MPWNHAQVAQGPLFSGSWVVTIAEAGTYRIEARRWPREARAPITGVPKFHKKIDAWKEDGEIDRLLYGHEMKMLPVKSITLEIGEQKKTALVNTKDTYVAFDIELSKGDTKIKSDMRDKLGNVIAGTYYVYLTKLN